MEVVFALTAPDARGFFWAAATLLKEADLPSLFLEAFLCYGDAGSVASF